MNNNEIPLRSAVWSRIWLAINSRNRVCELIHSQRGGLRRDDYKATWLDWVKLSPTYTSKFSMTNDLTAYTGQQIFHEKCPSICASLYSWKSKTKPEKLPETTKSLGKPVFISHMKIWHILSLTQPNKIYLSQVYMPQKIARVHGPYLPYNKLFTPQKIKKNKRKKYNLPISVKNVGFLNKTVVV